MSYVEKGGDVSRHPHTIWGRYCVSAVGLLAACLLLWARVAPAQAVVHLAYFEATAGEYDVLIEWGTGVEQETYGFELYRAKGEEFGEATLIHTREAEGQPTGADYDYTDGDIELGVTYYYWLRVLDFDGDTTYGPESATPGPPATSTPLPTATGMSVPTATRTSAPTATPTTSTSPPTVTPSFTATGTPTSSPAGTATATPVSPSPSSPSPTSAAGQGLSPTPTPGGMTQPTLGPATAATEGTSMPASTTAAGTSATSTPTAVAGGGGTEPAAPGWLPWRLHLPAIQPSTILLFISLASMLGALLLFVALALVRKLSF